MKVILIDTLPGWGNIGDEIEVKGGFARNYLIPKGIAVEATEGNRRKFAAQKKLVEKLDARKREHALAIAKKIAGKNFVMKMKAGDKGTLFGSVTALQIAELLKKEGVIIDKRNIVISTPIKKIGEYKVELRLHNEVKTEISLTVEPETEE